MEIIDDTLSNQTMRLSERTSFDRAHRLIDLPDCTIHHISSEYRERRIRNEAENNQLAFETRKGREYETH